MSHTYFYYFDSKTQVQATSFWKCQFSKLLENFRPKNHSANKYYASRAVKFNFQQGRFFEHLDVFISKMTIMTYLLSSQEVATAQMSSMEGSVGGEKCGQVMVPGQGDWAVSVTLQRLPQLQFLHLQLLPIMIQCLIWIPSYFNTQPRSQYFDSFLGYFECTFKKLC